MKRNKETAAKTYAGNQVAVLLEDIGAKFDVLSDGQKVLEKKMGDIEVSQATALEKITNIEIDVRFIKNNLKAKVDQEEFQALERRLASLEEKVASLVR